MSQTAALAVSDVGVSFAGLRALDAVSFEVGEQELLGLIGPNGAGKTTLVNVITGFQRSHDGEVRLFGRRINRLRPEQRGRAGLARTFQGVRLFDALSVQENIEVSALNHGGGRRAARRAARQAIEVLGLEDSADQVAGSLSYGDQRRLALARCLAMMPKVILMDEPAAGLNETETSELGDAIQEMRATRKIAIVLIEHDVALVMRLSDRILVLAEGRPLATGSPAEIRGNQDVAAAYLGVEDAEG